MANISTIRPETVKIPRNYPEYPQPGKIFSLWESNKRDLYRKLSPYDRSTFLFIKTRHPFIYNYPDQKPGGMARSAMREFPFSRAITDVERVTKFMFSGQGVLWLGKQFLLQTGNAFNETRIYNPLSPILGAAMPISLWAFRPQRNIDISGGVGSIVASFLGPTVGSIFSTRTSPPPGTLGGALPTLNLDSGKGLLRAGTANKALTNLETKWSGPSSGAGLGVGKFLSNTIKELFGNFIPKRQTGYEKRSDERTYGLMLSSYSGPYGMFTYNGSNLKYIDGVHQYWFGGSDGTIRIPTQIPKNWKKLFVDEFGNPIFKTLSGDEHIERLGPIGFDVPDSTKAVKYGESIGTSRGSNWEASNTLLQYQIYLEESRKYPSKLTDQNLDTLKEVNSSLKKVIEKIEKSTIYKVDDLGESFILNSGNRSTIGYDRLSKIRYPAQDINQYSVINEYRERGIRVLENKHSSDPSKLSYKMASSGQFDGINTLMVLDDDKKISNSKISGWTDWVPHEDDSVAFYFFDVVNKKYIPFRSIIKGINETISTTWEPHEFVGRADKIYSYSGFSRTLSFSFTVSVNSIIELAPVWHRINYLVGLTKPANYTKVSRGEKYTKYMVPPMVKVTIGDLYKNLPILLATVTVTIPDGAQWETLNEKNSTEWKYLANYIHSEYVEKKYGQLPKVVEISVTSYILESERPAVGMSNFGYSPHNDDGNYIDSENISELDKFISSKNSLYPNT